MPTQVTATAKLKDKDSGEVLGEVEGTIDYNFGDNLEAAVALFGEEVIFTNFKQSAVIACQSRIRAALQQNKDGDALQVAIDEWKPGIKSISRKSPVDKLKALLEGKSPEDIAALLAEAGVDFDDDNGEEGEDKA